MSNTATDHEPPSLSPVGAPVRRRGENFLRQAGTGIILTILLTIVTGCAYPLVLGGMARLLFPAQANGSLLARSDGSVIGSALIGQQFTGPRYFHPRPSAAGDKGYDATSSGGSNLGPTNASLVKASQDRATAYRQENGLSPTTPIPVDAVTASGSGLDPDISPANALLQVHRVAVARGRPEKEVRALVEQHVEGRTLGILGEPRVNVLVLNLALDQVAASSEGLVGTPRTQARTWFSPGRGASRT